MSISVKHLTHLYSKGGPFEKVALNDINIEIKDGEFVGLIGHTGSGKSTLIQHFNALLKPDEGSVFIDGEDIFRKGADIKNIRAKVGLVFQYPEHQLFEETVYKDVAFGPKNLGLSDEEIERRVKKAINEVGLSEEILEKSPFDLSGGQKRRVAIAGVIAMEPKILILDEPTAGLDPYSREQILNKIKELHKSRGITVLLVTHSMEDIAIYADRIIVMRKGQVRMDDIPAKIFKREEELNKIGLDVPEITKILNMLRNKGFDLPYDIFTVDDAAKAIFDALGKRGVNSD